MPNQGDFRGEMPSVVSLRFPGHRILGRVLREVSRQDFDSGGPTTDIGAGSHRRSSSEATELVNVSPNMRVERHIQAAIWARYRDRPAREKLQRFSLEDDFRHHALVLMTQQVAMEERYTPDNGVRKIHHQIDAPLDWNVHCIQPLGMCNVLIIFGIDKKMNLMDVEGM